MPARVIAMIACRRSVGCASRAHERALFEVRQHFGHRRRLHPFAGGELAGAHRAGLEQGVHRRELGERDRHVDALVADDAG